MTGFLKLISLRIKMENGQTIKLLIATGNQGKFREISAELNDLGVECLSLKDFPGVPECEETGMTFSENAIQKARYYAEQFHILTLADDSGIEVDALFGLPGVKSARYAGEPCDDEANNMKLLKELQSTPPEKRQGRFRCVMAVVDAGGGLLGTTEGVIEGMILDKLRGSNGFGYDPLFLVPALGKTTAEISQEEKNKISHRGQAVRKMHELLQRLFS
jgi:XTP/dITP diphosphohydrolase